MTHNDMPGIAGQTQNDQLHRCNINVDNMLIISMAAGQGGQVKVKMTKKRLEAYRSEKQEIIELRHKLHSLKVEDYTGNDVIMDYRSGFPVPQSVVGTDIGAYWARREYLISKISHLERRCQEVEQWIEQIPESISRRIFKMYYLEGKSQDKVAKAVYVSQASVSKKLADFEKWNKNNKSNDYNKD